MLFMFKTQPIQVQILIFLNFILKNREILNKIVLPLLRRRCKNPLVFCHLRRVVPTQKGLLFVK